MKDILFVCNSNASFVRTDLGLLQKRYDVRVLRFLERGPLLKWVWVNAWCLARLPFYLLTCRSVFVWFISYQAVWAVFWARLLRKPSVVIPSGYGVANKPEFGYGLMRFRWIRPLIRFVVRHADWLLPVSQSNERDVDATGAPPRNLRVIPHGFAAPTVTPAKRDLEVLTTCLLKETTHWMKGLDIVFACAEALPQVAFTVQGRVVDEDAVRDLRAKAPANVSWNTDGEVEDLMRSFARARVLLHPSRHESFGMVVAEAMLCGAVPVVRNFAALPEVVGEEGFLIDGDDVGAYVEAIRAVLEDDAFVGKGAEAVQARFALDVREEKLMAVMDGVLER